MDRSDQGSGDGTKDGLLSERIEVVVKDCPQLLTTLPDQVGGVEINPVDPIVVGEVGHKIIAAQRPQAPGTPDSVDLNSCGVNVLAHRFATDIVVFQES